MSAKKDSKSKLNSSKKPDWAPERDNPAFAVKIVDGVNKLDTTNKKVFKKREYSIEELVTGILANNRTLLSKAITFVESNSLLHREKADVILDKIMPYTGKSIRLGISGIPGAGKSTLIEAVGLYLIKKGYKVAVLTVDPSSSISKGSILGDKTRMEELSKENNAFIRPSPSGGSLGGVTKKTRETMLICEAAGFDYIIVETVGVGQSEITVRSMVDFFALVLIPGGGDELQGIKKGIVEICDAVLINKADGNLKQKALMSAGQYRNSLHFLQPYTTGWEVPVLTVSALENDGIEEFLEMVANFYDKFQKSGFIEKSRKKQNIEWLDNLILELLLDIFHQNERIKLQMQSLRTGIESGKMLPNKALKIIKEILTS
ncbi:MAG: methylmalonyl Co-A mutase-associated GTPase MeaB [Ignavibacteriaceae bacterium]|nr:methylmalonyl Co-A mutase-associated GTPase MeaB [Ignavibacteriaceae bacterium]